MTFSVLIVDDTAECRRQARACLVALGVPAAAVREAEHGAQALALLRQQAADLLITDLDMPVMGGFELLHAIEHHERFQVTARIVVTASTSVSLAAMLGHLRVAAVLRKPIDGAELGRAIAGLRLPGCGSASGDATPFPMPAQDINAIRPESSQP